MTALGMGAVATASEPSPPAPASRAALHEVHLYRDSYGMSHLYARREEDAFFGLFSADGSQSYSQTLWGVANEDPASARYSDQARLASEKVLRPIPQTLEAFRQEGETETTLDVPVRTDEAASIDTALTAVLHSERDAYAIPSLGVAVFSRRGLIWVRAAGFSDKDRHVSASVDTIFRAGSVSKTVTDLIMMRLVDRGVLDLDVPVRHYLPDFAPKNPFGAQITLRMLATHRAGLVREPPLGSYFATSSPDLATIVRSLNRTTLIARPGTRTLYSNAGVTVIGRVLEVVTGKSFAQILRDELLTLAQMRSSGVRLADSPATPAYAEMSSYDGPRIPAPTFDLGMAPAGGLYTTLRDLTSVGSVFLREGRTEGGLQILSSRSLREMTIPASLAPDSRGKRYSIGFAVADFDGRRVLSHSGAVYGFVTSFKLLPDDDLGVVTFSTVDAGSSAERVSDYALRLVLAMRDGRALPLNPTSWPLSAEEARPLVGEYHHAAATVRIRWVGGVAYIETPQISERLRRSAAGFVADDTMLHSDLNVDPSGRWIDVDHVRYARSAVREPEPPTAKIERLMGDYGWDHEYIRVFERDGALFVRIEWIDYERMERVGDDVWRFPNVSPLYPGEELRFTRDASGRGHDVSLNGLAFPRREIVGASMHVDLTDADRKRLLEQAHAASPPVEVGERRPADLVSLTSIDPEIELDVRYATSQNTVGFPVYPRAAAYMQRPAAQALARAEQKLRALGFGVVVFDAYRPWYVTKLFWDGTPEAAHLFVADPREGSRHNRGAAVDMTLQDLATKREADMTGAYDEYSPRSYPLYDGGSSQQRWRRDVLRETVESEGFTVYPYEWWHFDFGDWRQYAILNVDFKDLSL
jgi:CubicO group peptidase (beta-lactamase class C family)/D-alanyl-D-alanine dipeptidase